eukprot:3703359-Pyramimonas_sp.AAC.1
MAGTMRNPTPGEQITHFFQTRKKQILLLLLAVALMVISVLGLRGFMLVLVFGAFGFSIYNRPHLKNELTY